MHNLFVWWRGFTNPYTEAASQYMTFYQREIAIALGVAIVIGLIIFTTEVFSPRKSSKVPRGNKMVGQAREAEMRVLVSDKVCDVLEDLFHKGKLSLEEKMMWEDRFCNLCDLRDLVSSRQLTTLQKLRMSQKKRLRNGPTVPVPIPEPTAGPRVRFK